MGSVALLLQPLQPSSTPIQGRELEGADGEPYKSERTTEARPLERL